MADGIRAAFEKTVAANAHLAGDLDAAIVEAGRTLARQIDFAVDHLEGQDVTKALYLTPHLVNILREMQATPAARAVVVTKTAEAKSASKLASVSNIPRPA